jgi:hypothetical protein
MAEQLTKISARVSLQLMQSFNICLTGGMINSPYYFYFMPPLPSLACLRGCLAGNKKMKK